MRRTRGSEFTRDQTTVTEVSGSPFASGTDFSGEVQPVRQIVVAISQNQNRFRICVRCLERSADNGARVAGVDTAQVVSR